MANNSSSNSSTKTRKISWVNLAIIAVMMVVGILFIVAYAVSQTIVDYIIGAVFVVAGVGMTLFAIVKTGRLLTANSVVGVLLFSVGVAEFADPSLASAIANLISWFIFIMGIVLFLVGIVMLVKNTRANLFSGVLEIVSGAVMAVLGGLMLFPLDKGGVIGTEAVWLIAGIVIVLLSIILIVNIFFPSVFSTKVTKKTKVEK